ncbi:MAG: biopolymer transporter ExbD [Deltaproteobacteria bacterium]|jgi:biopolymer transport protein ExbD
MRLSRKARNSKHFVPPKLQITSMMDMFTIILIFLLFSFSNKPETMSLQKDLKLPESTADLDYNENINLVLSQTSLELGGKVIGSVKDGRIIGLDPQNLKNSKLYERLRSTREGSDDLSGDDTTKPHILFLCDKRLPFKTINSVVKAAAMAGYPNFQFGVLKK